MDWQRNDRLGRRGATGIYLNTGGRYNPSTSSWVAITNTSAPDGRSEHTAVWTGSAMIVWGGYNGRSDVNTGGRYNPIADSWVATATAGAPEERLDHTAVWTGSEMIIWGGLALRPRIQLNSGARYNPITDTWVATTNTGAPARRWEHTAVWTGSEMIVWGGANSSAT